MSMMPPPTAADDVSPLALRNDAARFTRNDVMFALCARRHTSSAKRHHTRSAHHLPDRANIIEKSTLSRAFFCLRTIKKIFLTFGGEEERRREREMTFQKEKSSRTIHSPRRRGRSVHNASEFYNEIRRDTQSDVRP